MYRLEEVYPKAESQSPWIFFLFEMSYILERHKVFNDSWVNLFGKGETRDKTGNGDEIDVWDGPRTGEWLPSLHPVVTLHLTTVRTSTLNTH